MVLTESTDVFIPAVHLEKSRKLYDVVILHASEEQTLAAQFRDHLLQDVFEDKREVSVKLVTDTCFSSIDDAFDKCTFAFIYLTKSFCENDWADFSREGCVINSLYNRNKRCRLIPIMTVNPLDAGYRIPMGINALKAVNFYIKDEFYRRSIVRLLSESRRSILSE